MNSNLYQKLNETLIIDKKINAQNLKKVLNAELDSVCQEYLVLNGSGNIEINVTNNGFYEINYKLTAKNIKNFGFINNN